MSKPILNPYAKRKAPAPVARASDPSHTGTTSTRSNNSSNNNAVVAKNTLHNTNTAFAAAASLPTGFSFSQAFQSIEDTSQYQQASKQTTKLPQQEERAQQRALDQQQQQQLLGVSLSDRDVQQFLPSTHLLVSPKQRGNGLLQYIRNVPWQESRMVPDYIMGTTRCALFLSCKYHSLHPHYIHRRLAELKSDFTLRVLLVLVDEANNSIADNTLFQLNKLAVVHNMTLVLAWSEEEAARYLETYQAYVGKDASLIQKKKAEARHFGDQVADVLSKASVNKTDAAQLLAQFSSIKSLAAASVEELATVSGMGQVKVKRLHDAWHKPFSKRAAAKRRKERMEKESAKDEKEELLENDEDEALLQEQESLAVEEEL